MSLYFYKAELDRVVDGDTLDLFVDIGFGLKIKKRFRLLGIDCEEQHSEAGKKATCFDRDWETPSTTRSNSAL